MRFCPECDGNTYLGQVGVDERRCPTCAGKGMIEENQPPFPTDKPTSDQHEGERPHGIGCPGCREKRVCNQCGEPTTMMTGRCVNGRCRECCARVCRHQQTERG